MKKAMSLLLSVLLSLTVFSPAYAIFDFSELLYEYGGTAEAPKYGSASYEKPDYSIGEYYENTSKYYSLIYSSLNDYEKMIYDYIINYETLGAKEYIIDTAKMEDEMSGANYMSIDFEKILFALNYDRPDYFWIDRVTWSCSFYDRDGSKSFSAGDKIAKITMKTPYSDVVYPDIEKLYGEIFTEIKKIDFSNCKSRYEFMLVLHDYIAENLEYTDENIRCYDIIGALVDKKAVCMGYSFAAKIILNYYNIPNMLLVSEGHMWNVVLMEDGKWYNLDITWDDQDCVMYDYFLCGNNSVDTHFGHDKFTDSHVLLKDAIVANVPVSDESYVLDIDEETTSEGNHYFELSSPEVPATCTAPGKTAVYSCIDGCGLSTGGEEIPATGHDMQLKSEEVPATCSAEGKTAVYACANGCGLTTGGKAIPKKSHTYSNGVCKVCGDWQNKSQAVKLSKAATQDGSVKVTWSKLTGASGYYVYRKAGNAASWTKIAKTASVSYVDKSVKSGTKYTYTVKGYSGTLASKYDTKGVSVLYLAKPAVKLTTGNGNVKVSWSKVAGAKGYIVYRKYSNKTAWTKIYTATSGSCVALVDKSVRSGNSYDYLVKAYSGSTYSVTSTATVLYLATPKLLKVSTAKAGVTVKWEKVLGATGYIVYRKTGNGKYAKLAAVKGNTKVSYLDKAAKKGVTYTYTVKAYKGSAVSSYNSTGLKIKDKY